MSFNSFEQVEDVQAEEEGAAEVRYDWGEMRCLRVHLTKPCQFSEVLSDLRQRLSLQQILLDEFGIVIALRRERGAEKVKVDERMCILLLVEHEVCVT